MLFTARVKYGIAASILVAVASGVGIFFLVSASAIPEAKNLRRYVHSHPPVPVVFTSRTEPASFQAAAPDAEGFTFPGTIPWTAREGRLRLLDTGGKVYELTWTRPLPDGGTLIDAMSPSVSLDDKRILFAGRKAPPDPGRWRIYQVGVDGSNLKPLTGELGDPGCVELPPLRYATDGSSMSSDDRKQLDYDDVDPIDCAEAGFAFASSRLPDLGRDHSRRATQVWLKPRGTASPRPLSANRNNDRWPFLTSDGQIMFSLWSRNREAVTDDLTDIRPVSPPISFATKPTDLWVGARVLPDASQFGYAVKASVPVWRPRPLFNGRIAFMTEGKGDTRFRLAQAEWGHLQVAPSSLAADGKMPASMGGTLSFGPDRDAEGRPISAGCPSPCPGSRVLFAAAPTDSNASGFGLYLTSDDWSKPAVPQLLFDDPAFEDAEPVAVYPRPIRAVAQAPPLATGQPRPEKLRLFGDRFYSGALGMLENHIINAEMPDPFPGQKTDSGASPIIPYPTGIKSVVFYAAHRDRFDDPILPRKMGTWEKLLVAPLQEQGAFRAWVPADPMAPIVLAGLDENGKVFKWNSRVKDSEGRSPTFYAIAGDHYSGIRAGGYHFCLGCHTGHTFIAADIREKVK